MTLLQWVPEGGVEIFSYFLHAHLLGVAMQIDWYRDGKHIGVLAYDDDYDFNFQESRHLEPNQKLLPVSKPKKNILKKIHIRLIT